jgi:hypothetical protein
MALRVTIPLGRGEAVTSFASRLAAANGLPVREFCLDWDIRFQSVVDGDAAAIAVLADKGGVAAADLMAHAFIRGQNHAYTYRDEQLTRFSLRRKRVAVCPYCLAEDIANSDHRPHLAVYGRAIWQIDAIKSCPVHQSALVEIADDMSPTTLHEFTHHVAPVLLNLAILADQAVDRKLTGLENYVLARLDGVQEAPFLDSQVLFVAIKLCEMLGAVELFGRTANLRRLSDEQWRLAGAAGFVIAAGGAPAISGVLGRLQATFDYSRRGGTEGPQALYGRIYQWLEFGAEDAAYDPVRDVIGRHIRDHLPLGPGDTVFGEPVIIRTLHSVRSLSLEAQVHPKRLRKLLRASGIIGEAQDHLADANVIFASGEASSVITRAKGAMSLPAAGEYLNAPRVHRALLVQAGFLVPCLSAAGFGAVDQFAVTDLDEFLRRLLDGAEEVKKPKAGQVDIPAAAKRANCKAAEIVRLILDKKLKWVGRLSGVDGYLSVLVEPEEIRGLVRGDDHGGLTPYQVAGALGTTDRVARALIKHGHLKTVSTIHPVNRCPQVVVMPAEVERFQKKYVSLFGLAKERGRHFRKLKQELDANGVKPPFDPETIGATFYVRDAVSHHHKPKKGKLS